MSELPWMLAAMMVAAQQRSTAATQRARGHDSRLGPDPGTPTTGARPRTASGRWATALAAGLVCALLAGALALGIPALLEIAARAYMPVVFSLGR